MSKYFSNEPVFLQQSDTTNAMKGKAFQSTTGTKGIEGITGPPDERLSIVTCTDLPGMSSNQVALKVGGRYLTQLAVYKTDEQADCFLLDISDDE